MNLLIKKVISVIGCSAIVVSSVVVWFYIEIAFDGCCGAPSNYSNDGVQSLAHIGAYGLGLTFIYLLIHWGWKHSED